MTRRRFVQLLTCVASAFGLGLSKMVGVVTARRFRHATCSGKFPGRIVEMGDVRKQAKWSG